MKRLAWLLFPLALAACGPQGAPANNAPANYAPAPAPANKPEPAPKEDLGAFRRVGRTDPDGWVRLNKDGQSEVLGQTKIGKARPSNWELLAAVTHRKEPGPTEGKEHWDAWSETAVAALLYFVGKEMTDPAQAVREIAPQLAEGFGEAELEGECALAWTPDGKLALVARRLEHGMYIVVGVVQDGENAQAHRRTMRQWMQDLTAQADAD